MAEHNELGKWGEQLACDILLQEGAVIRERNWTMGKLEIDIIAVKGDTIIFAEVKTRENMADDPIEAVDARKIKNIVRAANAYMMSCEAPFDARFDLFAINGTPDNYKVEHLPDAFDPPLRTY